MYIQTYDRTIGIEIGKKVGAKLDGEGISGLMASLAWNGVYFTKQYSYTNMILNPMFKLKAFLFGRDISRF